MVWEGTEVPEMPGRLLESDNLLKDDPAIRDCPVGTNRLELKPGFLPVAEHGLVLDTMFLARSKTS